MRLISSNNLNAKQVSFGNAGFVSKIAEKKLTPSSEFIKSRKFPYMETIALVTAAVSTIGFSFGGIGLIYDCIYGKSKGNKHNKEGENTSPLIANTKNNEFENIQNIYKKIHVTEVKDPKKDEIGYIEPDTKVGKIGLMFSKIGVGFSGIAGIFNGIAMKIPLMSAGEAANVAASPIINTAMGSGLLDIGLAAIFAGRALENDPALKLNPVIMASKQGLDKVKYVVNNMWGCAKEVSNSAKAVFGNTFNLFVPSKRKNAINFLKDNILAVRPTTVQFSEKILADGTKVIEKGLKSPPHRMHTASLILAIGGAIKVVSSLFNNKTGQKAGFRVSEVGGGMDNIGLSMYGLERTMLGNPLAGIPLAVSGATILAGQPTVDKKEGRSLMWLGCGALFLTFFFDRHKDLRKAFNEAKKLKNGELVDQSAQLIRTWTVPLTSVMERSHLKPHLSNLGKAIGAESKSTERAVMELDAKANPVLKMVDTVKGVLEKGLYNPDTAKVQAEIDKALTSQGGKVAEFAGKIEHGSPGDTAKVLEVIHYENAKTAGIEYTPILKTIAEDSRYNQNGELGKTVVDSAKEALKKQ